MARDLKKEMEEFERKKRLEQLQAEMEAHQAGPSLRDRATAVTQGASWNWGDELTSATAATIAKVMGEEGDWGDIYRDIHSAENARYDQYMEENPGEAMGLELAGGFLSRRPNALRYKNIVDTGRRAKYVGRPARLDRARRRAAARDRLKQMERHNQGPLTRGVRAVTRNVGGGMVEGAIAGAGMSEGPLSEAGWDTALGAGLGGVIPAGLNIGKAGLKGAVNRRVTEDIGRGINFKPLHLAAAPGESNLVDLYRNTMKNIYGARGMLIKQQKKYLDRVDAAVERGEITRNEADDIARQLRDEMKDTRRTVRAERGDAVTALGDDMRFRDQEIDDRIVGEMDEIDYRASTSAAEADRLPEQAYEEATRRFQARAAHEALPSHAPLELRQAVMEASPRDARDMVNKWWAEDGFRAAKEMDYFWEGGDIWKNINAAMAEDPRLALEMDRIVKSIPDMADTMQEWALKGTRSTKEMDEFTARLFENPHNITGEAFMELRNVFARKANETGNMGYRRIADQFDKSIFDQLSSADPNLANQFLEDKARWRVRQQLNAAVKRAGTDRQGNFDYDDWRKVGSADYPDEVDAIAEKLQVESKRLKKAVVENKKRIADLRQQERKATGKKKTTLKRALDKERRKKAKNIAKQYENDGRLRDVEKRQVGAREQQVEARRGLSQARKLRSQLKKRELGEASNVPMRLAATSALGLFSPTTYMTPWGVGMSLMSGGNTLASGATSGMTLASPTAQRLLAGQTASQKKLAEMGRRGSEMMDRNPWMRSAAERLRESGTRYYAGKAGD